MLRRVARRPFVERARSSASTASRSTRRSSRRGICFHRLDWSAARRAAPRRAASGAAVLGSTASGCSLSGARSGRCSARARRDDVPGFEIPARYFQFVRSGMRGRSRRCSSTTGAICCRWPALTARLLSAARRRGRMRPTMRAKRWRSGGVCTSAPGRRLTRARDAFERAVASRMRRAPVRRARALRALALLRPAGAPVRGGGGAGGASCSTSRAARRTSRARRPKRSRSITSIACATWRPRDAFALKSLDERDAPRPGTMPSGIAWPESIGNCRWKRSAACWPASLPERTGPSSRLPFPSWPWSSPPSCGSPTSARRTSS